MLPINISINVVAGLPSDFIIPTSALEQLNATMHFFKGQNNIIKFQAESLDRQVTEFVIEALPAKTTFFTVQRQKVILPNSGIRLMVHTHCNDVKGYTLTEPLHPSLTFARHKPSLQKINDDSAGLAFVEILNISNDPVNLYKGEVLCSAVLNSEIESIKWETESTDNDSLQVASCRSTAENTEENIKEKIEGNEEEKSEETKVTREKLSNVPISDHERLIAMIDTGKYFSDTLSPEVAGQDPAGLDRTPKQRILEVLKEYSDHLAQHRMDLGRLSRAVYVHDCFPLNTMPETKRFSPYKAVGEQAKHLKDTLEAMEDYKVLERDQPSPYCIPCFIHIKSDCIPHFTHSENNVSGGKKTTTNEDIVPNVNVSSIPEEQAAASEGLPQPEEVCEDTEAATAKQTEQTEPNDNVIEPEMISDNELDPSDTNTIKNCNDSSQVKVQVGFTVMPTLAKPKLSEIIANLQKIEEQLTILKNQKEPSASDTNIFTINLHNLEHTVFNFSDQGKTPLVNSIKQKLTQYLATFPTTTTSKQNKTFECDYCKEAFEHEIDLFNHNTRTHLGQPKDSKKKTKKIENTKIPSIARHATSAETKNVFVNRNKTVQSKNVVVTTVTSFGFV